MQVLNFDGTALKTVSAGAGFADQYYTSLSDAGIGRAGGVVGNLSALAAYSQVPWLYRAVNLRASLVSRMPFALVKGQGDSATEVTDKPEYESIVKPLRKLLALVEMSLCLTGQAYLYVDANARGKDVTLRYVRSNFIKPHTEQGRLTGFDYNDTVTAETGIPRYIPLNRMLYFWNPNMESAVKPGPGEVQVALGPASVLWAIDSMAAAYFNSGGVKVSVFSAPAGITDGDKEKFQNFLNRRMSGVWNAFKHIVLRNELKPPVVIGSDLKDTQAPELTTSERESVAVALGLAPPVIDMEHANKATAQTTMLALYTMTIIPRCETLFDVFNEQLFDAILGQPELSLQTRPEELEEVQGAQMTQAISVDLLTGHKATITQDEGRDLLGYGPMDDTQREELTPKPVPAPLQQGAAGVPGQQPDTSVVPDVNRPDMQAKSEAYEQFEQIVERYAAARKLALASVGQAIGVEFDDELIACKTSTDTRKVLERHYPRKSAPDLASVGLRLAEAMERVEEMLK